MTAEIDTFINEVSTTRTNIAAASSTIRRRLPEPSGSRTFVRARVHVALSADAAPSVALQPKIATETACRDHPPGMG